jgi:glycosyltransferase involved in cell wall biosynthesis
MKKNSDNLVIILAFNEANAIAQVIDDVRSHCGDADIVVINDGSTDKTSIAVAAKDVHCISHIFNMGIGASFQTGCLYAVRMGYSYIVRLDGDGQHGAKFLQELLTAVRSGRADIVIGSRLPDNGPHLWFLRYE